MFGPNVAYPNYGYMGVPLAIMAFGNAAALPLAPVLFADTIILPMLTAGFVVGNGGGLMAAMWRTLVTMAKNPLLISVLAGLGSAAWSTMPAALGTILGMLAASVAPVALFAVGATVYGQPVARAIPEVGSISMARLILHPALVAALFLLVPGQDIIWIQTAILASCLPVAANGLCCPAIMAAMPTGLHRQSWSHHPRQLYSSGCSISAVPPCRDRLARWPKRQARARQSRGRVSA